MLVVTVNKKQHHRTLNRNCKFEFKVNQKTAVTMQISISQQKHEKRKHKKHTTLILKTNKHTLNSHVCEGMNLSLLGVRCSRVAFDLCARGVDARHTWP